MAGGKVVKVDRVIYENMPTSRPRSRRCRPARSTSSRCRRSTCSTTLEERPEHQGRGAEQDRQCRHACGSTSCIRRSTTSMRARRCSTSINQDEFMKAIFGNPKYYKKCGSNFACGTPMENDENTEWFKEAPNLAKAKELFQKAGYDGTPGGRAARDQHRLHEQRRRRSSRSACARPASTSSSPTSDWGGVDHAPRRQDAAGPGRLEHLHHLGRAAPRSAIRSRSPATPANGEKGWFGWPTERAAREAARQMGRRRDARGAEGGRARDAEERLGLRAARLARPVALAGRLPQEPQGRARRSRRSSRSGTSRRPERRSFNNAAKKRPARAGRFFGRAAALLHEARARRAPASRSRP